MTEQLKALALKATSMKNYDTLIERLRNSPNWQRESYGDWKQGTVHYDRAPFEAATAIRELQAENKLLKETIGRNVEHYVSVTMERDELRAKLAALTEKGEQK